MPVCERSLSLFFLSPPPPLSPVTHPSPGTATCSIQPATRACLLSTSAHPLSFPPFSAIPSRTVAACLLTFITARAFIYGTANTQICSYTRSSPPLIILRDLDQQIISIPFHGGAQPLPQQRFNTKQQYGNYSVVEPLVRQRSPSRWCGRACSPARSLALSLQLLLL